MTGDLLPILLVLCTFCSATSGQNTTTRSWYDPVIASDLMSATTTATTSSSGGSSSPFLRWRASVRVGGGSCALVGVEDVVSGGAARSAVRKANAAVLHLFCDTPSAALTLNENCDPTVRTDLHAAMNKVTQRCGDSAGSASASLIGHSLSLPVLNGEWNHGTWQGIYVCNFARSARDIEIIATLHVLSGPSLHWRDVVSSPRGALNIFPKLRNHWSSPKPLSGIAHLEILHTSASLSIMSEVASRAMENSLSALIPEKWNDEFFQHTYEGSDDMPAHAKTAVVGPTLSIPLSHSFDQEGVYLVEHRDSGGWGCGHSRTVVTVLETSDIVGQWTVEITLPETGWTDITDQIQAAITEHTTRGTNQLCWVWSPSPKSALVLWPGNASPATAIPMVVPPKITVAHWDLLRSVLAQAVMLPLDEAHLGLQHRVWLGSKDITCAFTIVLFSTN
ncbi:UPF0047 protein C4A8.02c [Pelomyxa schiedti]|nr:UPF0047 protein C4A8.02c [Pelomyxa schiedti]